VVRSTSSSRKDADELESAEGRVAVTVVAGRGAVSGWQQAGVRVEPDRPDRHAGTGGQFTDRVRGRRVVHGAHSPVFSHWRVKPPYDAIPGEGGVRTAAPSVVPPAPPRGPRRRTPPPHRCCFRPATPGRIRQVPRRRRGRTTPGRAYVVVCATASSAPLPPATSINASRMLVTAGPRAIGCPPGACVGTCCSSQWSGSRPSIVGRGMSARSSMDAESRAASGLRRGDGEDAFFPVRPHDGAPRTRTRVSRPTLRRRIFPICGQSGKRLPLGCRWRSGAARARAGPAVPPDGGWCAPGVLRPQVSVLHPRPTARGGPQ
jgi:hypothetical protein